MVGVAPDGNVAPGRDFRQHAASHSAVGARGFDDCRLGHLVLQAAWLAEVSSAMKILSPSILIGIVRTHPSSAPKALPVSSEITQLCSGHVTAAPWTMPWLSGPPLCGQWSSMAKTSSSAVRKTAILPCGVATQRAPRLGMSEREPIDIQVM